LNLHAARPDSYAACEIFIRTESTKTTFGGGFVRKSSYEEVPERAWTKDFPYSGNFAAFVTVVSKAAIKGQGMP